MITYMRNEPLTVAPPKTFAVQKALSDPRIRNTYTINEYKKEHILYLYTEEERETNIYIYIYIYAHHIYMYT